MYTEHDAHVQEYALYLHKRIFNYAILIARITDYELITFSQLINMFNRQNSFKQRYK